MNTQLNSAKIGFPDTPRFHTLQRSARWIAAWALLVLSGSNLFAAERSRIRFDIPDKIACVEVTPPKCASAFPSQKVIEVKFRVSAHFLEGSEADVVNLDYQITSQGARLRILDYLPNTTLESTFDGDRIEVADSTENTLSGNGEAKVGYSILSLGGAKTQGTKKTEENKYKKIAPKSLVLASGTSNRGHGVFFKLKPSNTATLEGAKEFSFLALVPKTWRGDWCEFTCTARVNKKSLVSSSIVTGGLNYAHVGLYLAGDPEGSSLASALCDLQELDDGVLAKQLTRDAAKVLESTDGATGGHTFTSNDSLILGIFGSKSDSRVSERKQEKIRQLFTEVEYRLESLADGRALSSR